jgi:hypothetical protein
VATDDINVFGSLRDFIADQSMQAVERDRQKLEAIRAAQEQFTPTPAQSAYLSAIFAPGSGVVDAAGQFPEFPSSDVALIDAFSGDPMPSIAENIAAGGIDRYLFAPLQAVGVAGDAMYAANPFIAGLPKGIATLGAVARAAGKADKKGIKALRAGEIQQDINTFARDSEGFVSPSLEALIAKAPVNLKGKQISEWLSANANKGVKPKELEFLGVDEFIANNPNASVREVAEGVSQNKVEVTRNISYSSASAPEIEYFTDYATKNPLDGSDLAEPIYKDLKTEIDEILSEGGSQAEIDTDLSWLLDHANNISTTGRIESVSDISNVDEVAYDYAKAIYNENPYDIIRPVSTDETYEVPISKNTFAIGNPDDGYRIFLDGQDVTPESTIRSQTEAQIQLRGAMEEGGDPIRIAGEEDPFTETMYKQYVDENLPGGENYREITFDYENAPVQHNLTHPGLNPSGNYLAHALIRDRKLADGSTSLHVDELQSDLHQKGSRDGYDTQENREMFERKFASKEKHIDMEVQKLKPIIQKYLDDYKPFEEGDYALRVEGSEDAMKAIAKQEVDNFLKGMKNARGRQRAIIFNNFRDYASRQLKFNIPDYDRMDNLKLEIDLSSEMSENFLNRAPNYPFKDDWHVMSIKQLVKEAIDEGTDNISISTSYAMKDRYADQYETFYETLYDKRIPSAMKKLANKYGGKFEKGKLDIDDTFGSGTEKFLPQPETGLDRRRNLVEANIIRITPEMKQKILEEGLPSFRMGGSVNNFIAPEDINIFA